MKTLRFIFDLIEEGRSPEILGKQELMLRFKDMMKYGLIEIGDQRILITPRGQELRRSPGDTWRPDWLFPTTPLNHYKEEFQVLRLSFFFVFFCWAVVLFFFLYCLLLCCG